VFERFTQEAREVVVLARQEARELRHSYIGTEHLLLGLLREEEGLAARALEALDITAERTREEVVRLVRAGDEGTVSHVSQVPFTPRAKRVLERSLRESLRLGHHYIGPEHILLGLTQQNDGVAARILLGFDADAEKIRDELFRMLPDATPQAPASGPGPGAAHAARVVPWQTTDQSWFGELGAHMNGLAKGIRRELDRAPDTGDLLLALACAPDTLAAKTLRELGVGLDALQAAIERKRTQSPAVHPQADETEGPDHERRLAQGAGDAVAPLEVIQEIRQRLGIANAHEPRKPAG
jgi:Clp amino terminal domain, pathogenicity island component